MEELSENACILLKAIGEECKKEEEFRNDIESNKLPMKTTDFNNAMKELDKHILLVHGKYNKINDATTLNKVDGANIIINSPKLTSLGDEIFSQLK